MTEFVLVDYAKYFAIGCHGNQKRKYDGLPYWTHPEAVVSILSEYYPNNDAYIAAWLHDVVEDTWATCFDIKYHFNDKIAQYVSDLTMPSHDYGNRTKRLEKYNEQLANSCELVQTVKYADLIHNTESIIHCDPNFYKVYLEEKKQLIPMIDKGEPRLYRLLCEITGIK